VPTYRKLPVEIEAFQFYGSSCAHEWPSWFPLSSMNVDGDSLMIPTLEGDMEASPGDYIIQGVAGEIYPCKPDIFEQTYEIVN